MTDSHIAAPSGTNPAPETRDRSYLARPAVYLAVVAVSFSAILVRLTDASGMTVALYRMLFSTIFMIPLYLVRRPRLPSLRSREFRLCILSGLFLGLHFSTWISSLKYTSVASSVTLVTTQPLFVAVLAAFVLGERIGRRAIAGMALALLGSIALVYQGSTLGTRHLFGDLLSLSGAVFASAYLVLGRQLRRTLRVESYALLAYGASAATIALACAILSPDLLAISSRDALVTCAMALICTMLGHTLFNWSLEFVSASFVAVMILGEPIGASVWAALLFHEIPTVLQTAACCVLLTGMFVFTRQESA